MEIDGLIQLHHQSALTSFEIQTGYHSKQEGFDMV
jgi:hypothetical protein